LVPLELLFTLLFFALVVFPHLSARAADLTRWGGRPGPLGPGRTVR
jgi:hypothetical protein